MFANKPKKKHRVPSQPSLLTAKDYIDRFLASGQCLRSFAESKDKNALLKGLRDHRDEVASLVHKVARDQVILSE